LLVNAVLKCIFIATFCSILKSRHKVIYLRKSRAMRTLLLFATIILTLASCKSVKKMVEKGDYDGAIAFAAKKLQGKENKKTKYVKGLESAFAKITARDMATYHRLENENRSENWDKMYNILSRVETRQRVITPLIPLVSNEGYHASFKFVKTDPLMVKARHEASKYHYTKGLELIAAARIGDKQAAREAHHEFNFINRYFTDYKESIRLSVEALFLGTNRILIRYNDNRFGFTASRFYDELSINPGELNTRWTEYYIDPRADVPMDYEARITLLSADVSRDNQDERYFTDRKSIRDGFNYELDSQGNVKKDTLGNDIRTPKFIDVEARIIEVYRYKEAAVEIGIEVVDLHRDVMVDRERISHNVVFEDYSCTISGDRRALSDNERNKYRTYPLAFPSDSDMLVTAANEVRRDVRNKIKRSFI